MRRRSLASFYGKGMSDDSSPVLQASAVSKTYSVAGRREAAVTALRNVSLQLPPQTFTAIVGPSGCGKSTLLHCLAGLDQPSEGKISILGKELTAMTPAARAAFRAAQVGFVFQDYNLISSLSVADNVALVGQLRGKIISREEIQTALKTVGIDHRAALKPHQLSGGERQRVAIARVLANRTPLIFADEPTGALDIESGAKVLGWLRSLTEQGSSVVMVTHDIHAAALADQVLVMQDGAVMTTLRGGDPHAITSAMQSVRSSVAVPHA